MRYGLLCWYRTDGLFWFRLLGYGLVFADRSKRPPLFSERNGLVRHMQVSKWSIRLLRPDPDREGKR